MHPASAPPALALDPGPDDTGLFDPGSGVACVILRAADPLPHLPAAEQALTRRMMPVRRREFTWGRIAARRALSRLGAPAGPLLPDADRVPVWPAGITGSISHSGRICGAAVRRGPGSVGFDLETEGALTPDLWEAVLTETERDDVRALPAAAQAARALALFTAKEAVYKAHFPVHRVMFGFADLEIAAAGARFVARFPRHDGAAWQPVQGRWSRGPGWTASGVLLAGPGPAL